MICLVGENGTGKSSLFELIAAVSNLLGLSQGMDSPRGLPLNEPHELVAEFALSRDTEWLLSGLSDKDTSAPVLEGWNGKLTLHSRNSSAGSQTQITAGGSVQNSTHAANIVIAALRQKHEVLYLAIDADRSYPQVGLNTQSIANEFINQGTKRETLVQNLKSRAYQRSSTIYSDWEQSVLLRRYREAKKHYEESIGAARAGDPLPSLIDPDEHYRAQLQRVLPHLHFVGSSLESNSVEFDSSDVPLRFAQLSGGEREIAFIIGQIERFGLRNGLLLIDEPELHLNPDLVRQWVSFLRENVEDGQAWIATHSMEAVEATGADSTYVLTREHGTRLVTTAPHLSSKPVMSTLSAALGTPGFSLSTLAFVFVEGEAHTNEVQRFFSLYGDRAAARFISGGSCLEVIRKAAHVKELASVTDDQLHVGAIVDRDFRSEAAAQELVTNAQCFVLPCHEVENLLLHPSSLNELLLHNGIAETAETLIQRIADQLCGQWVLQHALFAVDYGRALAAGADVPRPARELAGRAHWAEIDATSQVYSKLLAAAVTPDLGDGQAIESAILAAISEYRKIRFDAGLWKVCLGKEVLGQIHRAIGYSTKGALESAVISLWSRRPDLLPSEVQQVRRYIDSVRD